MPESATSSSACRQMKLSDALGRSTPGSRPLSHRIWKPLQMPSTLPPPAAWAFTAPMMGVRLASAPGRRWSPYENPPGMTTATVPSGSAASS